MLLYILAYAFVHRLLRLLLYVALNNDFYALITLQLTIATVAALQTSSALKCIQLPHRTHPWNTKNVKKQQMVR